MSWLARSFANSLRGEGGGSSEGEPSRKAGNDGGYDGEALKDGDPLSPTRGIKEDLSELTKTITRQFWGAASFLAPPPPLTPNSSPSQTSVPSYAVVPDEAEVAESPRMTGVRSDLAELSGKFKCGISMLSNTMAVSELSKIASSFLPLGGDGMEEEAEDDGEDDVKLVREAVGVTDEVLLFVRNISMHPETWLDFPLIAEDDCTDDFEMSNAQHDHALAMEHLVPRLAVLRIELCPSHMSEGCFWKIYFVLLHSRLNKDDAELLSTPQIVQVREMLLHGIQNLKKPNSDDPTRILGIDDEQPNHTRIIDIETEKLPYEPIEVTIVDKSVVEEDPPVPVEGKDLPLDASFVSKPKEEEYEDGWLEDEMGEGDGSSVPLGNDEEVSFSDLEEEDEQGKDAIAKTVGRVNESKGWVQLKQDPNYWLNLDEIDVE